MNEGHSHQFWATVTVHVKMMVPVDDHHSGWSQATRHIRTSWSTRNPRWLSTDLSSDTLGAMITSLCYKGCAWLLRLQGHAKSKSP